MLLNSGGLNYVDLNGLGTEGPVTITGALADGAAYVNVLSISIFDPLKQLDNYAYARVGAVGQVVLGTIKLLNEAPYAEMYVSGGTVTLGTATVTGEVANAAASLVGTPAFGTAILEVGGQVDAAAAVSYRGVIESFATVFGASADAAADATGAPTLSSVTAGPLTADVTADAKALPVVGSLGFSTLTLTAIADAVADAQNTQGLLGTFTFTGAADAAADAVFGSFEVVQLYNEVVTGAVADGAAVASQQSVFLSGYRTRGETAWVNPYVSYTNVTLGTYTANGLVADAAAEATFDKESLAYLNGYKVGERPHLYHLFLMDSRATNVRSLDSDAVQVLATRETVWKKVLTREHIRLLGDAMIRIEGMIAALEAKADDMVDNSGGVPAFDAVATYADLANCIAALAQAQNATITDMRLLAQYLNNVQVHMMAVSDRIGLSPALNDADKAYLDLVNARGATFSSVI